MILVTGASGHIGSEVCRFLLNSGRDVLAVDVISDVAKRVVHCDLTQGNEIERLFRAYPVDRVIHAAAVLPTASQANPLAGADVNLAASIALLRESVRVHVQRFLFVSSMSVYGALSRERSVSEDDPAIPDEPYGGAKRAIELVGAALRRTLELEFTSLRVARVIGAGATATSSPWRSQMFETHIGDSSISIPFAPETVLSLVHVEDVARMLGKLVGAEKVRHTVYNAPAELWKAGQLKAMLEEHTGHRVELGSSDAGGPACDGTRFVQEFSFTLRGLEVRLKNRTK